MPDENFRDKAYMIQALAQHIEDVNRLKPFADPKKMTRDIRYGLTHGLAIRGKLDGIPLLIAMAVSDPVTLIRQQAQYGLADIQDAYRLRGDPVPEVRLPAPQPLEVHYPPRGFAWTDTRFDGFELRSGPLPTEFEGLTKYVDARLKPDHFRNLGNAYVRGADRMMTAHVEETAAGFTALQKHAGASGRQPLVAALETPYPFAHYLAARALGERGERVVIPVLLSKLEAYLQAQDFVGFWWCCEALGRLQAREALPVLIRHATASNPPGTFGPEGMAVGYITARTLAHITGECQQADVARLLTSDNIWLRAGALRGLAEARAPGIEALLRQAARPENPALVRHEALVQLRSLAAQP
jgi:hypothetical protein